MRAKDLIEQDIPFLKPTDSVGMALNLMAEEHVRQLVLVGRAELPEILDENALLNFDENELLVNVPALHTENHAYEEMHLLQLAHYLADKDLEVCPIIDYDKKYLGSVKASDIYIKVIKGTFSGDGALIGLLIDQKDYSLSDISRIVESEGLKIERLFLSEELKNEFSQYRFVIKFNKKDASKGISSLRRFGYVVELLSDAETDTFVDRERFGLLMKYLEI